jgi:hypothetical protein
MLIVTARATYPKERTIKKMTAEEYTGGYSREITEFASKNVKAIIGSAAKKAYLVLSK